MKKSNLLRNVHRMFTIPIYYNKRGKRKIPPHVLAFYSLSYLLLRERPDESPAVPVFCAHGAQAGIEWFVPVGARSARPGFALKGGGESTRASRAGMRPARPPRAQEGALRPLLRITPAGGCSRMPATANKFVHILWKNLFAIMSRQLHFAPDPRGGGADDVRFMFIVSVKATLRPGTDAPLWGGSQPPACRNSRWVADGRRH